MQTNGLVVFKSLEAMDFAVILVAAMTLRPARSILLTAQCVSGLITAAMRRLQLSQIMKTRDIYYQL